MKVLKMMLCGAFVLGLAACSSPESDGEKYAEMCQEATKIREEKGRNSEEYKEASKKAEDFRKECKEKYKDSKEDQKKFDEGYLKAYGEK